MAELYAKPFETIETGYNPQQPQNGGQESEMDSYLSSLPPEERQAAIGRLNAPLSGEELASMAGSGQKMPTLEEYAEIEKWHKTQEISFFDGLGKIAEGGEQVMADLSKAFGAVFDNPSDVASKMPATAVEAFSQGTRNFYGMLAESQNTDSVLFRVKDFLNGTGTIEDRYNQYISALKFNKDSAELMEGKQTLVMDKDMINHEVTQAMAYIADPTLFIPFGKVASTGLRAVGLGERLALAGAKSAAIKNGIIGNTLKWGVGQPLEFLGGAVRNTIDFGLDKAGAAFEATTGVGAKEFAQTARMSGIGFSASAIAGHAVPYASTLSDAYLAGSAARGFGEAISLMGDTMSKNKFGRGINSWAAEALEQAKKNGVKLSPHADGLLKALNAVDPMFAYGFNAVEASAQGAVIGGGLGYLSGGQEGMYSGIGAGVALGAVGGTAGKMVADVTGGTNVARRVVQAKMVIEGHKVTNPEKAMFFQAMQKTAEARGQDVDLVNGIIAGIDKVAPNFEFHAMTPQQFAVEAIKKGYNPSTGKFMELSAIDHEFGGDRPSKSKAMYILRSIGGDFVGDSKTFLEVLKRASAKDSANPSKPAGNIPLNLRKYTDVAKTFDKLTKTQQDAILREIDGQADVAKELGGKTKLRDHYDSLTWSEAWTDSLVKKFESDREGARKDIIDMLAQETGKDGKLNRKGRALADKLRAEGFLDKENKLLRERNLLQADMTLMEFASVKGGVMRREADGKTHMYINLNKMGSETFPHELFHTIMRESPMKDHFTKSLIGKLIGSFDDKGNLVRTGEVNINQVRKFFKKYIDLTSYNEDGTLNPDKSSETMKLVDEALAEFESAGSNKKISDKSRGLLEHYTEEFGAYYFSHWLMGRNRNTLFFGGELRGIEGLVERTKDSFKDFWQSKISKSNPEFDFSEGLNASFDRSKGLGRISSIDYYMRDMVRAASNANREAFNPDAMSVENLRDFERSNGLRNLTAQDGNRRLNPREQVTQNIRLGKEAHKILTGLDKNLRTSQDTVDENGKSVITGRLSENELDALVKGGIVPRAWADKVNQGYAMLDGTVSNVFSAGYLGKTEQTTDASYPRLTGKDVAFKNRKAVLFDVETKIKADGTFYTLFHTLDLAVIEQEANRLFQNTEYRKLFDGDRSVMEADFFRYISNASKASTDTSKLDSAALLDKGDGLGAQRRDVLHQMGRMALQVGDAYKHQPIAVIPEGIRHSVTTFNIDGMTTPRVESGARYDINMGNAHKFIRENWQPDDMRQETTPNGKLFTHESKFKFVQDKNGKVSVYTSAGNKIGTYGSLREATNAGKAKYNAVYKNFDSDFQKFYDKKQQETKSFEPLEQSERQKAIADGDLFGLESVKRFINGRPVLKFARDEFIFKQARDVLADRGKLKEVIERKRAEYAKQIDEKNYLYNEDKRLVSESIDLLDIDPYAELKKYYKTLGGVDELGNYTPEQAAQIAILREKLVSDKEILSDKRAENQRKRNKIEKRRSEILQQFDKDGVTDFVNMFDERYIDGHSAYLSNKGDFIGDKLVDNIRRRIESNLTSENYSGLLEALFAKEYDDQIQTGKPVVILGTHGTTNARMMIQRAFRDERLGERYANQGAFSATLGHFLGNSAETSSAYSKHARFGFAHPEGTDKFRVMDITWVLDSKIGRLQSSLSEPSDPKFKLSPDKIKSITGEIQRLKKQKAELSESYELASAEETKADTSLLQEAGRLYNYIWGNLDSIPTDKLVAESARILTILQYFEEKKYFIPQGDVYRLQRAVDRTIKKKLNIPFEEMAGLKPESTTRSAFDDLINHYEYFPNKTPLPMSSVYELYNGAENRNSIVKLRKHSVDRTFLSGRKINSPTSREYAQNDLLALFNQHTEIVKDLGLYEKFEYAKESGIYDAQDEMLNAYLESTTVERIIDQNPYKDFIDSIKKLQKEHDFQELLMPETEKAYPEASRTLLNYTPMKVRALMAFDNPMVVVDPRAYEEHFISPHMIKAIEAGHDGIIFKRFADGGSKDNIIVSFKGNENKIMELDTTLDKQTVPRKDDDGNLIKEKFLQPDDELSTPKITQGIKLDMNRAYDVFRKEYEESTGQSWTREKFMQRSQNWQFFGDENGFVAVRPQKSGFIKLVGMAGDNKSKLRAIQQLQEQKLPVWGMVSKDIKDIAVRRGMREPNMIERTVIKQALNSVALGDAEIIGYTSDNGVRLRYPDVGEVVKYMIGSPEYYQKLRSAFGDQIKSKIGFQPDEGKQGGRTYTEDQFNKEFIGRFASENPEIADKFLIRIKENDGNTLEEYDYKIIIYDKETKKPVARSKWQLFENDENGKLEDAAADVEILNDAYKGMKLSHLMQSERLERSRSLGAEKIRSQITNQEGIPIKNYAKTIGADKGEIASALADRFDEDGLTKYIPATMENFKQEMDLSKAHDDGTWKPTVYYRADIDPKAWYQPDEGDKIGSNSSNIKLLLEGLESGRILRTSSYKGLGLEDAELIAHIPDTAKVGTITAGDKALGEMQGGVFYAIANGNLIWASNFAGEDNTNVLLKYAQDALAKNPEKRTYIILTKPDNSKNFSAKEGARVITSVFSHLNDTGVITNDKIVRAFKKAAENNLGMKFSESATKQDIVKQIDERILTATPEEVSFGKRGAYALDIVRELNASKAFKNKERIKKLEASFHNASFPEGLTLKAFKEVFGNLLAEDFIKDVPVGHVYGALEITKPLKETTDSRHRGYDRGIMHEDESPAKLILFDKTAHVTEIVNKGNPARSDYNQPIKMFDKEGDGSQYHSWVGGNIPYQQVKGKSKMPFQPAEGWRDWQSERTSVGSVIKNTAGYVIMVQGDKFKVYNPYKTMIGIYDNEDQAKRRVQKDEPRR